MKLKTTFLLVISLLSYLSICLALSIKHPEFGDQFYPAQKDKLTAMLDGFLDKAAVNHIPGEVLVIISPHAGYGYSGPTAAYGYKLIKDRPYKTVVILGTSHHKPFSYAAVYPPQGSFETSLGTLTIDDEFTNKLIGKAPEIFADETAFSGEHSVEVELPFLQSVLKDFKIVPLIVGDCSLESCKKIASLLKEAIGERKDVLIVVSTDLYHGYDIKEADQADSLTLEFIKKMDYEGLYYSLRDAKAQACGGFGVVIGLNIAQELGYDKVAVLNHTNSAIVTGSPNGQWTVGYSSIAVYNPEGEHMLNNQQRKKLLELARNSISAYLQTGKKMELSETDPLLKQEMGAFVTLNKGGQLRGCIGNLSANQPLYLTIRDMAVEAAIDDPRFSALTLPELKDIEIEISVLSPLKRVDSAEKIELGKHGVLVRKGYHSGVFLPQVATETGWSKEEFLNTLCTQKAGLPQDAWKDKDTELYIFEAEVFSEK